MIFEMKKVTFLIRLEGQNAGNHVFNELMYNIFRMIAGLTNFDSFAFIL
jgi:hypothetical protein